MGIAVQLECLQILASVCMQAADVHSRGEFVDTLCRASIPKCDVALKPVNACCTNHHIMHQASRQQ